MFRSTQSGFGSMSDGNQPQGRRGQPERSATEQPRRLPRETLGYAGTPFGGVVTSGGRIRRLTIGELVEAAYERAARLANDPEVEATLATRFLASWLARATLAEPEADTVVPSPLDGAAVRLGDGARRRVPIESRRSTTTRHDRRRAGAALETSFPRRAVA